MDDIRYSELIFLRGLEKGFPQLFSPLSDEQTKAVGLSADRYAEMAAMLIEDLYVRFHREEIQLFVARLRGELGSFYTAPPPKIPEHLWHNPRQALTSFLDGTKGGQMLTITYRGLRRIQELRDLLRQDRVLEDFGVLLSIRYLRRDLEDALQRASDMPVSVVYADMDDFGKINKKFGQAAGDVVMKAYLEAVRDSVEPRGQAYRGVGDETATLIVGQGHERAISIAETIRERVAALNCKYKEIDLPSVSASIGVATTPPASRSTEVELIAEDRKRRAKAEGKNRVIAS